MGRNLRTGARNQPACRICWGQKVSRAGFVEKAALRPSLVFGVSNLASGWARGRFACGPPLAGLRRAPTCPPDLLGGPTPPDCWA